MPDSEVPWEKQTVGLPASHGWRARPGNQIFVADRGAVRFDFPEGWVVVPSDDAIEFHDRMPPDDDCTIKLSVMRLPPVEGGWGKLPLERLVREVVRDDSRGATGGEAVTVVRRDDLELAWTERRFIDPNENRPALSRCCLARARNIQPLITMDFWEADREKFAPVWDEVLRSLQVAVPMGDPRRGDIIN